MNYDVDTGKKTSCEKKGDDDENGVESWRTCEIGRTNGSNIAILRPDQFILAIRSYRLRAQDLYRIRYCAPAANSVFEAARLVAGSGQIRYCRQSSQLVRHRFANKTRKTYDKLKNERKLKRMTKQIRIGKTDLIVNPIGLGTSAVGGHNIFPNLNEEVGKNLVRAAINHGVNFLDTAFFYGTGRSEELVGEVIKEAGNRHEFILATKGGLTLVGNDIAMDNSPAFLKQAVEDSLKRLQTDYIDLFYIHVPDQDTPKDEAVGVLKQLKDEGKIRAIGVSNFSLEQLKEANKDGYIDILQGNYNLLQREAEQEFFPYTTENNISFIPYFPLASGLLAGKYNKDMTFNDLRKDMPLFQVDKFTKNLEKVEQLRKIANEKNAEVAHVVLAWYLTHDSMDVVIPGAKRAEQVLDNLKTLDVHLTEEEINEIDRIFK